MLDFDKLPPEGEIEGIIAAMSAEEQLLTLNALRDRVIDQAETATAEEKNQLARLGIFLARAVRKARSDKAGAKKAAPTKAPAAPTALDTMLDGL